jgi:dephospho-CoA kinase
MSLLQIGVTGGIGSGKSLVCKIFSCLGVPVYDADSRAKYVMTTDRILIEQIQKEFGNLSYNSEGVLNRNYLGERVFNEPEQLKKLNSLVHPRVAADYATWVKINVGATYVIKEAALLFESGSAEKLDKIISVYAPESLRIQRVLLRDTHRTVSGIKEVMENQMNEEEKKNKADFVIVNDESSLVIPQVLHLHERFNAAHKKSV